MEYVMFQETGAVNAISGKRNTGRSVEFKVGRERNIKHFDKTQYFVGLLCQTFNCSTSTGIFFIKTFVKIQHMKITFQSSHLLAKIFQQI